MSLGNYQQRPEALPKSILVLDDDPDAICLLEYAFKKEGPDVRVEFFKSAAAVIEHLQGCGEAEGRHRPGLLLLDLKMPGIDGFDLLQWLRNAPDLRPEHVVVFSASGQEKDRVRAFSLGIDAYHVKPGTLPELRRQVNAWALYARSGIWVAGRFRDK